jgi:hypothetical protein
MPSTTSDAGSAESDAETEPSEFGFQIRTPGEQDLDWLCTFGGASTPGYVYVQLLQTGMQQVGIATIPVYEVQLAQLALGEVVSDLDNAQYDYGGGHHNDSLSFDYEGATHRFYHSSFGFGFRACQPMDCRDVYELGGAAPTQDGCTERSIPEVCVAIQSDGSHAPLTDTFMTCAGDQ